MNICIQVCVDMFSQLYLSYIYLGVELLGHVVTV